MNFADSFGNFHFIVILEVSQIGLKRLIVGNLPILNLAYALTNFGL